VRVFGWDIEQARELVSLDLGLVPYAGRKHFSHAFQTLEQSRGWYPIQEGFTGAWQRNIVTRTEDILTYHAVYACIRLIATDIGKLRLKYIEQDREGVWTESTNAAYSPVLRTPNHFQTRQQFLECWMVSKLVHGNTYVLKQRNDRGGSENGNVVALYVLDPKRVRVLVAPDSSVYYALSTDALSQLEQAIVVPASEIIHDLMMPLYHPLCGVSPLVACSLAAIQGLRLQNQSVDFAANGSQPSGVLSTVQDIDEAQAKAIQTNWQEQFSGNNAGKVAVIGLDMKYQPMMMSLVDSDFIAQLKLTAEQVCSAFGIPPYMVGVGPMPSYNNVEALNQQYYSQALQFQIEAIEATLDKGLELAERKGVELDLDALLRMDTMTRMNAAQVAIKSGMSPDEVRKRFHGLGSVTGGDSPLFQQQDFHLEALAKRDAQEDPFGSITAPAPQPPPAVPVPAEDGDKVLGDFYRKALAA
jgi:HK97 family phage portal protein